MPKNTELPLIFPNWNILIHQVLSLKGHFEIVIQFEHTNQLYFNFSVIFPYLLHSLKTYYIVKKYFCLGIGMLFLNYKSKGKILLVK